MSVLIVSRTVRFIRFAIDRNRVQDHSDGDGRERTESEPRRNRQNSTNDPRGTRVNAASRPYTLRRYSCFSIRPPTPLDHYFRRASKMVIFGRFNLVVTNTV